MADVLDVERAGKLLAEVQLCNEPVGWQDVLWRSWAMRHHPQSGKYRRAP